MDIKRFKAWAESKKLSTDGETGRNYSYTFYDSKTQAAWGAWQAKAQAVPEGFVVVPMEPTEQILNRMTNAPIEVNHLCDNADIFLSEDEARIAYKAMIEALEPAND